MGTKLKKFDQIFLSKACVFHKSRRQHSPLNDQHYAECLIYSRHLINIYEMDEDI